LPAWEEALSEADRRFLAFGTVFERDVVSHPERRSLEESMEAGWRALRALPRGELHRLSDRQIEAHLPSD
jgi:V/A-type H+-transporting ATPase subunit B